MNILVTGGLGHIGSKLITSMSAANVCIVDNVTTQRYSSLFNLPESKNIRFFEKDVRDLDLNWFQDIGPIDIIIHLAATTDAAGNANNRDALFENNLKSTGRIGHLAKELGIKLIFPSSTSVYGSQDELVDESCKELFPQSPYAESKLAEEEALLELAKDGLQVAILRFGTIHGSSTGMRFHTAVNKFLYQAKLGVPITIWRTALHQKRPYLSLDDCISALNHVINNSLFHGEIYNVVTKNWTVQEIVNCIQEALGRDLDIEFVDSVIMNQLSYEVSSLKFANTGFEFRGDLSSDIRDALTLLAGINNA